MESNFANAFVRRVRLQPLAADWRPNHGRLPSQDQDEAAAAAGAQQSLELERELARDHEYRANLAQIDHFQRKFICLAHCFRRAVNFFGLAQDVGLLLVTRRSIKCERSLAAECRKLVWLALMVLANALTLYVLVVHSVWELTRLDAKISDYKTQASTASSTPPATTTASVAGAGSSGWLILKDFLENMRRHLSRFFGLAMILVWHRNCHRFELLFVDCRRYYAGFYQRDLALSGADFKLAQTPAERFHREEEPDLRPDSHSNSNESIDDFLDTSSLASGSGSGASEFKVGQCERRRQWRQKLAFVKEQQAHFITTSARFYRVARRRIFFALCWPLSQVVLNLFGIVVNSSALVASNVTAFSNNGAGHAPSGSGPAAPSSETWTQRFQLVRVASNNTLAEQLLANFHAFHLAIHTAFHPPEHQIGPPDLPPNQAQQLSLAWSAAYCVAELFVHYVYVHGPRILGATCLSLVLSIHHQCLCAFNRHLGQLIRRAREAPLSGRDMVKLLKQYDMIGMMHERMELTFKWSLGLWFSHMFVSSLMLVFTLTESTSAALLASSNTAVAAAAAAGSTAASGPQASAFLETIGPIIIVAGRIVFICYGPWLLYSEAIKIETESAKTGQLVMMVARRQDDPVAQAIEPALFEPLCFSLAGFFNLSKRTVASLLGAIVTFSIMFIGRAHPTDSQPHEAGSGATTNEDLDLAAAPNNELETLDEDQDEDEGQDVDVDVDMEVDEDEDEDEEDEDENEDEDAEGQGAADEPSERRQLTRLRVATSQRPSGARRTGQTGGLDGAHLQLEAGRRKSKTRTSAAQAPKQRQEERSKAARRPPRLAPFYRAQLRENERQMSAVWPELKVEGGAEICDFELEEQQRARATQATNKSEPAGFERSWSFSVTWIDRISGAVTIEASELAPINCERQRNFTLRMRAIACNGLQSNEALMSVELLDVNEFSPEFERTAYALQLDQLELATRAPNTGAGAAAATAESDWCHLLTVRANDPDCSAQFGQVCRYELIESSPSAWPGATSGVRLDAHTLASKLAIERDGRLRARCKWLAGLLKDKSASAASLLHFQLVAFDCGGKKSQAPASVQLNVSAALPGQEAQCRAAWKDVDTQIAYKPASGEHWPFLRAHLDLCGARCGRLQLRVRLQLAASAQQKWSPTGAANESRPTRGSTTATHSVRASRANLFHCDRDPYAMVSKRRLCGSRQRALELLPPMSAHTKWVAPLLAEPPLDAEQPPEAAAGSDESPKSLLAEEENLGAYLPDGSYGRLASEFARLEMNASRRAAARGGSVSTEADEIELPAGRAISRHHRHQRKRPARELPSASNRQRQRQRHKLEPSAIYRDQVYHFDGLQKALVVPSFIYLRQRTLASAANINATRQTEAPPFGARHTLSFWLRHEQFRFRQQGQQSDLDELSRHVREHIICLGDKRPSRVPSSFKRSATSEQGAHHHYAVYLRDCKLHLSVRTRAGHHSEWRWTLGPSGGQLCDNKWHLLTLNVNLPHVELYVDGQQFEAAARAAAGANLNSAPKRPTGGLESEPEVANELNQASAQPTSDKRQTLLTVGACWEARSRSMGGHLRGALSGLSVVLGANDEPAAIECLGRCTEALVSSAPQHDQRQTSGQMGDNSALVSFQESQDRIQLEGHDLLDVEDALAQLAYVNRRELPSVGRRTINLETSVNCAHGSHSNATSSASLSSSSNSLVELIRVDPLEIELNVLPSATLPQISIAGTPNLAREHAPFKEAQVAPFESVRLRVKQLSLQETRKGAPDAQGGAIESEQAKPIAGADRDSLDYIDDSTSNTGSSSSSGGTPTPSNSPGGEVSRELSESVRLCKRRIEACNIQVRGPPLDGARERLELPLKQLELLQVYWRQSAAGALIYGLDCAENYEQLLRQIKYQLLEPELYDERHFRLSCSDMSGRLLSNDYLQTLTIIHPRPPSGGATAHELSTNATNNHSSALYNGPSGATLPPSRFASLRRSPELELDFGAPVSEALKPGQPLTWAETKLNRVAMTLMVFVVSMMLIMLVIALTKLTESAGGAAESGIGKGKRCTRGRGRAARVDCPKADSYFAQDDDDEDDDDEEEEPETEAEEGEDEPELGDSQCEHDDELEFGQRAHFVHLHAHHEQLNHAEPHRAHLESCEPFTSPCDSLSWDDEMLERQELMRKVPANIVMNPVLFGQRGPQAQLAEPARMLVAWLAKGTGDRPTSSLVPKDERAPGGQLMGGELLPMGFEDGASEGRGDCDLDEDELDEDLLEMDESASVCSRSRSSSSASELDETETEHAPRSPVAPFQRHPRNFHNFRPHLDAVAQHHLHFRHHQHFHHHHHHHQQQQQQQQQRLVPLTREVRAQDEQPSYQILHQHHHECLRAARRRQLEEVGAAAQSGGQ